MRWNATNAPTSQPRAEDVRDATLAAQGDDEAFIRLVQRHQGWIARRMWRFTRNREDHEELVQDVFLQAWRSLFSWRREGPFEAWLLRIALRTGYHYWRRQSRYREQPSADIEQLLDQAESDTSPEEASIAAAAVHDILRRLPPRDRLVLSLMYLDEMSIAEIATATGWSPAMVKVQAHRARKKLARVLEREPLT